MRPVFVILIVTLAFLQHKLWLGDGNLIQLISLEKVLAEHGRENNKLAMRNRAMEAEISELKSGDQALEEQARYELGMVKENETFYQFMN
ncbi:MAG: cell division protein FtsB [Legionella sp.]|jgi:cell division protein FtsB